MSASKPVVLILAPLSRSLQTRLAERYRAVPAYNDPPKELADSGLAGEASVAVTMAGSGMQSDLLGILPRLQLLCCYGTGYDNVDLAALKARGIRLTNGAGANAPCVSDMAMALLLDLVLRVLPADRLVREGGWNRVPPRGWTLSTGFGGRKLGIFGLGNIGLNVARRAAAFDLDIGYHTRSQRTGLDYRYFSDLRAMAEWCDYMVVACPLTPATRHAVNMEVLKALGPQGYLVNVARGAVLDEAAVVTALREGVIAGAGLDVFEDEPNVPAGLREAQNVILTPHIAATTKRAVASLDQLLLDNVAAFFAGKPLLSPVNLG